MGRLRVSLFPSIALKPYILEEKEIYPIIIPLHQWFINYLYSKQYELATKQVGSLLFSLCVTFNKPDLYSLSKSGNNNQNQITIWIIYKSLHGDLHQSSLQYYCFIM